LSKSILIAGGTGFIGFHLAKKCLSLNWSVTSLSTNKPRKNRKLKKVNYKICDVSNYNQINKKIKPDYDYVVNLAGYVDHTNKPKTMKSHYIGCKNLSNFFLNSKMKKFVQIGSCIEYGKIESPQKEIKQNKKTFSIYGKAKLLSTIFLQNFYKKYNFPVTILRLYLVYGPFQDTNRVIPITIINALKNKSFNCSNGQQLRDFTYIDDIISAIIKTLKNLKSSGEIINIGSGKPIAIKKVIIKICRLLNSGKPLFGKIDLRRDEMMKLYPNINKAKTILRWTSRTPLEVGLRKTIKFFSK
tara:strand:+ start:1120 stop:2019 length:900 start_codon:yes stop_codon:yes gene_type:complete